MDSMGIIPVFNQFFVLEKFFAESCSIWIFPLKLARTSIVILEEEYLIILLHVQQSKFIFFSFN